MTEFQHPQFLALRPWLALLAILHLLLYVQQWWWQRRQFEAAASARFGPALSLGRGLLKLGLWTAAAWFLLTALAVPLGPAVKVESRQSGADVILVVDVSSSMLAQDIAPDRLTALKQSLANLLGRLQGDRVGVIAFAGQPVVACPLTSDFDTVQLFLEKLDPDSVPVDGTGLGPALQMALDSFGQDSGRGRLVLLATDGEDTAASRVLEQAERAKGMGIPVFTLGIGTPGGALIPGRRDVFGRVYAKTWRGQPVRTKLDSGTLRRIAEITGAEYSEAGDQGGLARAAERVRALKQGLAQAQDRWVREPLYEPALLWAFTLFLAESLLSARAAGWRRWGPALNRLFHRWWHPKAALLFLILLPGGLSASARDLYNQGNQAYRRGDYEAAAEHYGKAYLAEPGSVDIAYNLGNALAKLGDPASALQAFDEAAKAAPNDPAVAANRKVAEKMVDRIPVLPGQGGGSQGPGGQGGGSGGSMRSLAERAARRQIQRAQPLQAGGGGSAGGDGQRGPKVPGTAGSGSGAGAQSGRDAGAQPGASALNEDRVQAMMNQLRLDQKRYSGAFSPLQKHPPKDQQPDPMQQMLEEMGMRPKAAQPESGGGSETKDW